MKKIIVAADHPHPTMSPDGTKIQIQSAILFADNLGRTVKDTKYY
jgi:hypothetical protein